MERHGIGTDASMATHINNILERNYAQVQAGRTVVPTELGITLVRGYQLIDAELCSPQVNPGTPKSEIARMSCCMRIQLCIYEVGNLRQVPSKGGF